MKILIRVGIGLVIWLWLEQGKLLQPSVLKALVPAVKKYGLKYIWDGRALNIFAYGRFLPQYIAVYKRLMPLMGPKGKKWMGETYHAKVLTPDLAKAIITVDHDIPLQDLGTKVIPYSKAREILLEANPDIAVTNCACRVVAGNNCGPVQVCMAIGHPFTDFVLEHQPKTTRRITKEEALEIMDDAHKRGCVHHAYFKDCALDQMYAICNCCTCCCTGFQAEKLGIDMISPSGYVSEVDAKLCNGSGECAKACPFNAITMVKGKPKLDLKKCHGCGVCVSRCPQNARKMVLGGELEPLDVRALKTDKEASL